MSLCRFVSRSFWAAVCFVLVFWDALPAQESLEDSPQLRIKKAEQNFEHLQEALRNGKKLSRSGSVSELRVRQMELQCDRATIELAILKDPNRKEALELLGAKAEAKHQADVLLLVKRLRENGSASERELVRAEHAKRYSDLRVQWLEQVNNLEQQRMTRFKMAAERVGYLETEYQIVERLYRKGSKSKTEYRRAKYALEIGNLNLVEARKELGASAVPVD